ncbi:MAG: quinol:cytochrome C oxidoreductase [Bacteroidia bacterium]
MNFTFTQRHKLVAAVLMAVGVLGIVLGAINAPEGDMTRTWASLLLGNFFFMVIALAGLAFVCIQYVAEVGWSAIIKRIPLAMSSYIWVAGVFMIIIFALGHKDIYPWTMEVLDHHLSKKASFLNVPFFAIRMVIYFAIWITFSLLIRKNALAEDELGGTSMYMKNRKLSAAFLVLYLVSSSMMAWDFIMSIDPYWFSTLFGWYVFASGWVSGLSMMGLIVVYLKRQGLIPGLQESHVHDIGKFMFGFSVFWAYLWFAQLMLYWFGNLPEEVAYFIPRLTTYRPLFLLNFAINFITPFLVLMTRDGKRKLSVVATAAIIILVGHWLDMYLMVMPGTVGSNYNFGWSEIGATAFFGGLFMFVVMRSLASAPLVAKNHPMLKEALNHNI